MDVGERALVACFLRIPDRREKRVLSAVELLLYEGFLDVS